MSMTDGSRSDASAPPGRGEWRFPARIASVPYARRAVRDFATASGADQDTVDAIALCVTEAATNAVLHAFVDRERGTLLVAASAQPGELTVRVCDDGVGMRPRTDSPGLGLGLPTMGRVAETLDIREGPGGAGTEVCMTFPAAGVRGGRPDVAPGQRYEVLAEVARIVSGDGWPRQGLERLVDVLVPGVVDASAIDVVDEYGVPRRIAGRIDADDGGDSSRWLATLRPRHSAGASATHRSLTERTARMVELTPEHIDLITTTQDDARRMAETGIRWWLVSPLVAGEQVLGLLHLGVRPDRGPFGEATIDFAAEIAARAAGALATTRMAADLARARKRFEGILAVLDVGVTVHDADGRTLYANDAAAHALGLASAQEVLDAAPGEIASRWTMTDDDGRPLMLDDVPGRRAARGLSSEPVVLVLTDRDSGEVRRLDVRAQRLGEEDLAVSLTRLLPPA